MAHLMIARPATSEYDAYYAQYIRLVGPDDVLFALSQQIEATLGYLHGLPQQAGAWRYAPDKWSVKQVLGHLIDTERVMAYRALAFARNDRAMLPGFEQDDWIRAAAFDAQPLAALADEFNYVRKSTLALFRHLPEEAWSRRGVANNREFTVRALAYIIAGHELHHLQILKTKYRQ